MATNQSNNSLPFSQPVIQQSKGKPDQGLKTAGKPIFVAGHNGKVMPNYHYKNLLYQDKGIVLSTTETKSLLSLCNWFHLLYFTLSSR